MSNMTLAQINARQLQINQRMALIREEANKPDTTVERMTELDAEVTQLTQERADLVRQSVALRAEAQDFGNVLNNDAATMQRSTDPTQSIEYRTAFMEFVMRRKDNPILHRADASTTTNDIQSVIVPTVITDQLFAKKDNAGSIFARVTKTNYPAGMSIKTTNFKPTLEWVSENGKSDREKATSGSIVFSGFKGQIRLAISLESQVMSLAQFEAALLDRILKACSRGFDKVIVSGTGEGQPTGILTRKDYTKNTAKLNNKTIGDYAAWLKVYAQIPLAEQPGAVLHINKTDWQGHILGMKDENGRVIALDTMGFGGALIHMFMGKEVALLEDQGLPTFDSITGSATASKATAFAYYFDDAKYVFNSNMQLTLRNYIDEETDEKVHKATIIADGKVVDDDGLLIICRDVDATAEKETAGE